MEVHYTLTLSDYVAFSCHQLRRAPSVRRMYALGWVLPAAVPLTIAALFYEDLPLLGTGALVLFGALYPIIYPFTYWKNFAEVIRRRARANPEVRAILGPVTLVLTEETLTEHTRAAESVIRWCDMKGVEVVGDATYIAVTDRLWAILPRYGFEYDEDYEAARAFALRKLTGSVEPAP